MGSAFNVVDSILNSNELLIVFFKICSILGINRRDHLPQFLFSKNSLILQYIKIIE